MRVPALVGRVLPARAAVLPAASTSNTARTPAARPVPWSSTDPPASTRPSFTQLEWHAIESIRGGGATWADAGAPTASTVTTARPARADRGRAGAAVGM